MHGGDTIKLRKACIHVAKAADRVPAELNSKDKDYIYVNNIILKKQTQEQRDKNENRFKEIRDIIKKLEEGTNPFEQEELSPTEFQQYFPNPVSTVSKLSQNYILIHFKDCHNAYKRILLSLTGNLNATKQLDEILTQVKTGDID